MFWKEQAVVTVNEGVFSMTAGLANKAPAPTEGKGAVTVVLLHCITVPEGDSLSHDTFPYASVLIK
jgi:hypothetical protein